MMEQISPERHKWYRIPDSRVKKIFHSPCILYDIWVFFLIYCVAVYFIAYCEEEAMKAMVVDDERDVDLLFREALHG